MSVCGCGSHEMPCYNCSDNRTCCRIEDVFEWILEVDEDALGEDRGRIQIIVEYQMNLPSSPSSSSSPSSPRTKSRSRRGRRHRQGSTSSSKVSLLSDSSVYRSVENRITAHVDIQRDNTYAIVPVVKVCVLVTRSLLKPGFIQTQSLVLASSQSWLPLLRPSIPIDWRLRLLRENFTQH